MRSFQAFAIDLCGIMKLVLESFAEVSFGLPLGKVEQKSSADQLLSTVLLVSFPFQSHLSAASPKSQYTTFS